MPRFVEATVEVSVPATSANLGPGYDALGLALDLRDRVTARIAPRLEISVVGAGAGMVPLDASHLVHRAMVAAFDLMECPPPAVRLHCDNQIPHSRGLGSSSAAIVAGICAARSLVPGGTLLLDDEAALDLAARLEGHADNVAPALLGGFTVAFAGTEGYAATRLAVDPRVVAVVAVPERPVATSLARSLLPAQVPHADASANAARAALLVAALGGRPELLWEATRDWLHQDQREPAMPETLALVRALRAAGVAAVVSGAGPSVLALVGRGDAAAVLAQVPAGWDSRLLAVDDDGCRVQESPA